MTSAVDVNFVPSGNVRGGALDSTFGSDVGDATRGTAPVSGVGLGTTGAFEDVAGAGLRDTGSSFGHVAGAGLGTTGAALGDVVGSGLGTTGVLGLDIVGADLGTTGVLNDVSDVPEAIVELFDVEEVVDDEDLGTGAIGDDDSAIAPNQLEVETVIVEEEAVIPTMVPDNLTDQENLIGGKSDERRDVAGIPITPLAASAVQSAEDRVGYDTGKGSLAARMQSAAAANVREGLVSPDE